MACAIQAFHPIIMDVKTPLPLFQFFSPNLQSRFEKLEKPFGFWRLNPRLFPVANPTQFLADPNTGSGLDENRLAELINRLEGVLTVLKGEMRGRKPHKDIDFVETIFKRHNSENKPQSWKPVWTDPDVLSRFGGPVSKDLQTAYRKAIRIRWKRKELKRATK